jgi:hypothetical protein
MSTSCGDSNINKSYIIQTTNSADIFSACTELYTNQILPCSGDTVNINGNINILGNVSGTTFYGDGSNLTGIIGSSDNYVSGGTYNTGTTSIDFVGTNSATTFSVNLSNVIFTGNTSGDCITDLYISNLYGCSPITLHDDIVPNTDGNLNLGTAVKRFRDINTISGTSTVWTSTTKVITPNLDLGLDSSGNTRIITADNSIIQNDILNGGSY